MFSALRIVLRLNSTVNWICVVHGLFRCINKTLTLNQLYLRVASHLDHLMVYVLSGKQSLF